jgi:hypothetical protein
MTRQFMKIGRLTILAIIAFSCEKATIAPPWISFPKTSGLCIQSIAIDANINKWFGTDNGIIKFDGKNWIVFNYNNSILKGVYYQAIAIDKKQNIWSGTMSAIGGIFELEIY